ncbi:MAG: long-chain fatty acid--CoA ligase [Caulobacteraceae bacterium]|nr:long-chain fatty acid--CoA ligase [Caulobacteraceae bacterium]
MTPGLMQTAPLSTTAILRHGAANHGRRQIVSRTVEGDIVRYDYAQLARRAERLAKALKDLGVRPGDRVATLAWNTHRHLELFYAVPGLGAVLHTVNPRLFEGQIGYILRHAGASVLLFDPSFAATVDRLKDQVPDLRHFILLTDEAHAAPGAVGALCYETLLAAQTPGFDWPVVDENAGAVLCYTSGTTGDPKGVLYSHRSIVLHAMAGGLSGAFGLSAHDVIMPCSSMYHATAWGLPYMALINGCKLVLPGDRFDPPSLHSLITGEGVTFSGGVPTIWTMYLAYLAEQGASPGRLNRVVIGGSAVPRVMAETFKQRYGVTVLQIWGMTETSPMGVVATTTPDLDDLTEDERDDVIWTRQGRTQFGIELKIVDGSGAELPRDGQASGALLVRGPWTLRRYYRGERDVVDAQGWFDTGDIATIDAAGFMRITDRTKDVIKSGGEWISSIDLENVAVGCPGVRIAAVIGARHPKWEERPLLVIEPHDGHVLTRDAVLDFLRPQIARWWTPDDVIFADIPLTATGKIDKKRLRDTYRDHLMEQPAPRDAPVAQTQS